MYQLFTDTDTDITPKIADEYGYKLISMPYSTSNGKDVYPYVDFDEFDYGAFYDTLRDGELPKETCVTVKKEYEKNDYNARTGKFARNY